MAQDFNQGIALFNEGRFFEAHEVLEDVWRTSDKAEKLFFQGLVQLAVALHHYSSGNNVGASSVLNRAEENLKSYPEQFQMIDLKALREEIGNLRNRFERSQPIERPQIRIVS